MLLYNTFCQCFLPPQAFFLPPLQSIEPLFFIPARGTLGLTLPFLPPEDFFFFVAMIFKF